jgi:hypothetical protein
LDTDVWRQALLALLVASAAGAAVYLGVSLRLGLDEASDLIRRIRSLGARRSR